MSEQPPNDNIRAFGESDRSDEFKQTRDKLVVDVNDWLKKMKEKRDNKSPLADGRFIRDTTLNTTDVGLVGRVQHAVTHRLEPGISLTGDGETTPLKLSSVQHSTNRETEIIEVTGTNPVTWQLQGGEYGTNAPGQEVVAAFSIKDRHGDATRQYHKFSVTGSGSIQRTFQSGGNLHLGGQLQTSDELQMAQAAFGLITETIR
jgi:hypothetical protein